MNKNRQPTTKRRKADQKQIDYYLSLPYTILLCPLPAEDGGGYHVGIPELEGCFSVGKTPNEAIEQIRLAQRLWIEGSLEAGDISPLPNNPYADGTKAV